MSALLYLDFYMLHLAASLALHSIGEECMSMLLAEASPKPFWLSNLMLHPAYWQYAWSSHRLHSLDIYMAHGTGWSTGTHMLFLAGKAYM